MLLEAQRKSHSKISTMGGQKEDKQSGHRGFFTGEGFLLEKLRFGLV